MSDNLAEEFRKAGIHIRDVVEMASFTDGIDQAINHALGEESRLMNGSLIEVTAIGETKVLGNVLEGVPTNKNETGHAYKLFRWIKSNMAEQDFGGPKVFRKVGHIAVGFGYFWTHPDLDNIYARCQRKTI